MKLIWHVDGLWETEWFRYLLADVVTEEIVDEACEVIADNAIHVVSINKRPLVQYEDYFRRCRAQSKNITLLHASDEWFSGGYRMYGYFDRVIRHARTYLATDQGIITVPLGIPNATRTNSVIKPASQRAYTWSFAGALKASRFEMVRAMRKVPGYNVIDTHKHPDKRLNREQYNDLLADSVFQASAMGNVNLDTWRFYEGLELGCISLVERRGTLDYFRDVFGDHPCPTFRNWKQAAAYCNALLKDPERLDAKQRETHEWWKLQKATWRARTRIFMESPSYSRELKTFAGRARNRIPAFYNVLRLIEVLRHQTWGSLLRRLSKPLGPLRRMFKESL